MMHVSAHYKTSLAIPTGMTDFIYKNLATVMADCLQQFLDFGHKALGVISFSGSTGLKLL